MILPRTTRLLAVFVMSGVTTVGGACAPARSVRPDLVKPSNGLSLLSWISEFTRPAGTVYPQLADPRGSAACRDWSTTRRADSG